MPLPERLECLRRAYQEGCTVESVPTKICLGDGLYDEMVAYNWSLGRFSTRAVSYVPRVMSPLRFRAAEVVRDPSLPAFAFVVEDAAA